MEVRFSNQDNWLGGHYGILILPDSSATISSDLIVEALWGPWKRRDTLQGPYRDRYKEPADQSEACATCNPCDTPILYGVARLPNNNFVPCGSLVIPLAFSAYRVEFFLPVNSLLQAYAAEGSSFSILDVSPWRLEVDDWLAGIAHRVHSLAPFSKALIGYQLSSDSTALKFFPDLEAPVRKFAILKPFGSTMKFLPRSGEWRIL